MSELTGRDAAALDAAVPAERVLVAATPAALLALAGERGAALAGYDVVVVESGAMGAVPETLPRNRMRRLLFAAGFVPTRLRPAAAANADALCYCRSARIADTGIVGVPAADAISMTALGAHGRFGNQLFQYAFLKLYALRNHLSLKLPEWPGEESFGLRDERSENGAYPELKFGGFDDDDLVLWDEDAPPRNVNFVGFFQEIPECWAPHRAFLRQLFTLRDAWRLPMQRIIDGVRRNGQTLVALHVRRGDYTRLDERTAPWFRCVPTDWYRAWLAEIWPGLANPVLLVATDGGEAVRSAFADYPQLGGIDRLPPTIPEHIRDFFFLQEADVLAICNSSFSRMAALLAEPRRQCFLPSYETAGFSRYDAWSDRAFWDRFATPEAATGMLGSGLAAARRRGIHYRAALGRALHERSQDFHHVTPPAARPCKICGEPAALFGVVDFNTWTAEENPAGQPAPVGRPIYYRRCPGCGFLFTDAFDQWDIAAFRRHIYNDELAAALAGRLEEAARSNARRLAELFPRRNELSLLDYGADNAAFVELLREVGFAGAERIDFFAPQHAAMPERKFDLVTCFDILERHPDPRSALDELTQCVGETGMVVFSAVTQPEDVAGTGMRWPRIGPRSGRISLFSRTALNLAWQHHGHRVAPLGNDVFAAFKRPPDFAAHLFAGTAPAKTQ